MKKLIWLLLAASTGLLFLTAQTPDIKGTIVGGDKVAIAIPDLRGTGAAQNLMGAFNDTLWNDISNSGVVKSASCWTLSRSAARLWTICCICCFDAAP